MTTLADCKFAFLKVETTGLSVKKDRVTAVAIIATERGVDPLMWASGINPGVPIKEGAARASGLTNELVESYPPFSAIADHVVTHLHGRVLIGWGLARFGWPVLARELETAGHEMDNGDDPAIIDLGRIARQLQEGKQRRRLDMELACRRYGVPWNRIVEPTRPVTSKLEAIRMLGRAMFRRHPDYFSGTLADVLARQAEA